jgi:hypothetical protein
MGTRRRRLLLTTLGLALAGGLLAGAPRVVSASPGLGEGTSCFPGTLTTTFGYTVYASCATETTLLDGTTRVAFHAHVAAPSVAPALPVSVTGFPCLTSRGPTSESMVTIAPDGQVDGLCARRP